MSAIATNLPPQYDPRTTEAKWQSDWETNEVFKADPHAGEDSYSIVIPPPNVTGSLHMGHAFNTALLDTLVRYNRMLGKNTLCLPGTDHASIAVQTILERQIRADGKTKEEVGREKFLKRAWEWKAESGGRIVNQLRRLGLSADWSRERFTMDDRLCEAVLAAFVKLHDEGLIYRGQYLVNWCPASQSAVSDLEVEPKEVDGKLWHFRYPLTDGSGFVEVATTRPETMLGDTGVAVNPGDERYQSLIGKTLTLPIMEREIPIVADELVDPSFGTGCVKVTPAHDPNDFEMGQRHSLPMINIMNKDGTLNAQAGEFAGQDRFVARKNVVKRLEELGNLIKIEDYSHTVPHSDRGKVPIEPLISTQWFVRIEPLAQKALTELDEHNSPRFVPERWTKVYRDWLVRLKDWCISRQLWWGHQIPAWYAVSLTDSKITDTTPYVVAHNEQEALEKAKAEFGPDVQLERDPDVLDTWFSSGLWPFSTMGWPEETADLATYFPNSTLVTGFDIIFFWVARMTMMAGHFTDQMPFKDVYIHGLVRDENGKKMSKSANNGIDPLILIDKYGADAVRYTLIREVAGAGQDISLQYNRKTDESESVEAARNFANKLWNAARFVLMNLKEQTPAQLAIPDVTALELSDRWILSRFYQTVAKTREQVANYGLGEAAKGLYEFIWGDFCDWYIELVKPRLRDGADPASQKVAQQTLAYVLEGILKLLHPFMPYVTEEIWHTLTQATDAYLGLQPYPVVNEILVMASESIAPPETRSAIELESVEPEPKPEPNPEPAAEAEVIVPTEPAPEPEPEPVIESESTTEPEVSSAAEPEPEPVSTSASETTEQTLPGVEIINDIQQLFKKNSSIAIAGGVVLGSLFALKLLAALLSAINSIPFVEPSFQLIGMLALLYFTVTQLLVRDRRQSVGQKLQNLIQQVRGTVAQAQTKSKSEPATEPETSAVEPGPTEPTIAVTTNPTASTTPEISQEETAELAFPETAPTASQPAKSEPSMGIESQPTESAAPPTPMADLDLVDVALESDFTLLIGTIRTIRNLRAEAEIKPGVKVPIYLQSENVEELRVLEAGRTYIQNLAKGDYLSVTSVLPNELGRSFGGVVGTVQVLIPLQGLVDIEALKGKLSQKLAKVEKEIASLSGRLQNENFVSKAPADVVAGVQASLAEAQKQVTILRDRLAQLE
ncbi:MAG: valine--tRNA ligase [Spirulina sp. SIO3F2]|nr:valine--tRNA ligase [Spirulina sp. SIO3F2]